MGLLFETDFSSLLHEKVTKMMIADSTMIDQIQQAAVKSKYR